MSYLSIFAKTGEFLLISFRFLNKEKLYPWYVFLFFLAFFTLLYMTLDQVFSLDDGFFHIRFAELLREKGVAAFTDFQSIYFSRMSIGQEYLVYYNFLFYLVLLPFTFIIPLVVGMKLYGVIALTVSFTAVYAFLRKVSVRYSFLWMLLFLIVLLQSGWLFRFTLARPFTLTPVFLVVMLFFIHQKRYRFSALVAFLYFFWHTATFFFPLAFAFGYFLFEQFYGKKPDWKMIMMPLLGTLVALFAAYLISPGVIAYLRDVIFPVFFDTALTKGTGIVEGNEVYGRDIFSTVTALFWFVATLFVVGAYEILRYIRMKRGIQEAEERIDMSMQPLRAVLFMASLVFLGATTLSGRFLDYFVYFCLLYIAIAVTDVGKFIEIRGVAFKQALRFGTLLAGLYLLISLSLGFYNSLAEAQSHLFVAAPAEWLNTNVESGKIIFNVDWSAFPTFYYFTGDRFRYATGLEPRFLYDLSPQLYWVWNNIGGGIACTESDCSELAQEREQALSHEDSKQGWYAEQGNLIADVILQDFKTDIVVTSINRKDLLAVMDNSKRFKKEYFDDKNSTYAVYRIVATDESEIKK